MFRHPAFRVDPWQVVEEHLDLEVLAQSESVFALSNGHIGLRGNLDEGEPHGLPGTYLDAVYELHPLPYAEAGYGYPESGQTVVNVTNGKLIRLLVDDEPFDVRYGELLAHRRCLDLRSALLERDVEWRSPAGMRVKVTSVRMVSLVQRSIAAVRYQVTPLDGPVRVVVQSELVANEQLPVQWGDPRVAAVLAAPLRNEEGYAEGTTAILLHRVRNSGLLVGAAMDHVVHGVEDVAVSSEATSDVARVTAVAQLEPGRSLTVIKFMAYDWSATRSRPAVHDQVQGAIAAARFTGWDGLVAEQSAYLGEFWARSDVEVGGDPEVQQAVRFGMFHVLQAAARAERRPIPAKGLTGSGYDGHTLWDTEIYVLGMLGLTLPQAAANALRWRQITLPAARSRARNLGLAGAAFPWRTINGDECSGYWPASTAAFHIAGDVAYAATRYVVVSGDSDFERDVGLELLVDTARLWRSLGHYAPDGTFRIDGVTGPDEYSALADNNVYTNLMAQLNLRSAAEAAGRHPGRAEELGADRDEIAEWLDAAEHMFVPHDHRLGVTPQAEGFTGHERWDFAATGADQYPLMLHFPYFDLYRKQVVKQADLVLAMHLRGDAFSLEQKSLNFDYYESLTVRDSSLSACTQAVLAAETGHLHLAHAYIAEAALIDLDDLQHNTRDGLHIASLAGAWTALVEGLGGLRISASGLSFRPRLPDSLTQLCFHVTYRTSTVRVAVRHDHAAYRLTRGPVIELSHYDDLFTLDEGDGHTKPIPAGSHCPAPTQPKDRAPAPRTVADNLRD